MKNFIFNLDNWTEDEYNKLTQFKCKYILIKKEIDENNISYLKGYCEMNTSINLNELKKLLPRYNIEKAIFNRYQSRYYYIKNKDCVEIGDWETPEQKMENDIIKAFKMCDDKLSIIEIAQELPVVFVKYGKEIKEYKALLEQKESETFRKINVKIYWGNSIIEKTAYIKDKYKKIFTVNLENNFPFDGYDGQKEILIDNFNGELKYYKLLKIIDGHQLRLNIKYGHRYAVYNTVIITSNKHPNTWYSKGITPELEKRIKIIKYDD